MKGGCAASIGYGETESDEGATQSADASGGVCLSVKLEAFGIDDHAQKDGIEQKRGVKWAKLETK